MIMWRAMRQKRMVQRTERICFRRGQKQKARIAVTSAIKPVLETEAITIKRAGTLPMTAAERFCRRCAPDADHKAMKRGKEMAPNTPAAIGWEKEPMARMPL